MAMVLNLIATPKVRNRRTMSDTMTKSAEEQRKAEQERAQQHDRDQDRLDRRDQGLRREEQEVISERIHAPQTQTAIEQAVSAGTDATEAIVLANVRALQAMAQNAVALTTFTSSALLATGTFIGSAFRRILPEQYRNDAQQWGDQQQYGQQDQSKDDQNKGRAYYPSGAQQRQA